LFNAFEPAIIDNIVTTGLARGGVGIGVRIGVGPRVVDLTDKQTGADPPSRAGVWDTIEMTVAMQVLRQRRFCTHRPE